MRNALEIIVGRWAIWVIWVMNVVVCCYKLKFVLYWIFYVWIISDIDINVIFLLLILPLILFLHDNVPLSAQCSDSIGISQCSIIDMLSCHILCCRSELCIRIWNKRWIGM
jgi:hypothetical protein